MKVLFDIGATNTRIGVSHDGVEIAKQTTIKTIRDFEKQISAIHNAALELGGDSKIDMAAGGVACPLGKDRATILWSPNLDDSWVGKNLTQELARKLNCSNVVIENDVAVVGLGEMHYGAGIPKGVGVYVTISTGVNSARFIDGHLDHPGLYGFETGHQYIDFDKSNCSKCEYGTAIEYCSGADMKKQFGKEPYEITDDHVWDEKARVVAYMLNNTIVHWSPEVIVLGGSMMTGTPGISIKDIEKHLREVLYIFPEIPQLRLAKLDAYGGLYGALQMCKQNRLD